MHRSGKSFASQQAWTLVGVLAGVMPAAAAPESPPAQPPPASRPASTQPAPIIHVDNPEYDFGDFWVGPEAEATFTISNRGSAPLLIPAGNIQVQCGCTTVGQYPTKLEPGESGKFPFRLRTADLRGRIQPKQIIIKSNDPVTPQLSLRLLGTFKKRLEVTPMFAAFGVVIGDDPVVRVLKVKNNADKPAQLQLAPVPSDRIKCELSETVPGKEWDLKVSTVLPFKPGDMQANVTLTSSFEEEKTLVVPVSGRVPDRLDLNPPVYTYSRPAQAVGGRDYGMAYFDLVNYGPSRVTVTEASVDDPAIQTRIQCRAPGKSWRIQLDIPFTATLPPAGRTLTVKTDDPEKPALVAKLLPPQNRPTQMQQLPQQPAQRPAEMMVGRPIPAFQIDTLEGKKVSLDEVKGKITILNFISPTCPYCKKQLPELEKHRAAYQDKGVRFVNVVNPNPTRQREFSSDEVNQLMVSLNAHLEVAMDRNGSVGNAFQATSYPTMVVAGKDGKIAAVNIGSNKVSVLPAQLDALLAGKPVPAAVTPAASPAPVRPAAATQPH